MKALIRTTTIRNTSGDGSVYNGSRTYHRVYTEDENFLLHSEENLRKVKSELKEEGYTEFETTRETVTFNRSRINGRRI